VSPITTHVLDTAQGKPGKGISVVLEQMVGDDWEEIALGKTDSNGRNMDLLPEDFKLKKGLYRISFGTGDYFKETGQTGFYPLVDVLFHVQDPTQHYHVPLLLSPYGYSTYRGS